MPKISPRYTQEMPNVCSRYTQDIPKISPRYPQDFPQISPRYPQDIPQISPRYAQYMLKIYPRYVRDIPKEIPKIFSLDCKLRSAVVQLYNMTFSDHLFLFLIFSIYRYVFSPFSDGTRSWTKRSGWRNIFDASILSLNPIIHKGIRIRDLKKCGFVMFSLFWALG